MPPRKKGSGWARRPKKKIMAAAAEPVLQQADKSTAKLPIELCEMIGSYLVDDPVSSICLGLTCRNFMMAHRKFHEAPTHLDAFTFLSDGRPRTLRLLLNQMFYARGMTYMWEIGRYSYAEKLLERDKTYKELLENNNKDFRKGAEKDKARIEARKGQFGDGDYGMDGWSDFSVLSEELDETFYLPPGVNSFDENDLILDYNRRGYQTPSVGSSARRIDMSAVWGNGSDDESGAQNSGEANSESDMDPDNGYGDSENDGNSEDDG